MTETAIPLDSRWLLLLFSADGNFEVTLATKATLYNIYHSYCEMDVEYFPFDEQTCIMKFGSWAYDGFQVNIDEKCNKSWCINQVCIDVSVVG